MNEKNLGCISLIGIVFIILVIVCIYFSKTTVEGLTEEASDDTVRKRQVKDQHTRKLYNLLDDVKNPSEETRKLTSSIKNGLANLHRFGPKEKIEFVGDGLKKNYGEIYGDPNTKQVSINSPLINFEDPNGKLTVNNKTLFQRKNNGLYLGEEGEPVKQSKVCFIDNDGNEECINKDTLQTLKKINSTSKEYDQLKSSVNTFLQNQEQFDNKVREVLFGNLDEYAKNQFVQDLQALSKNDINIDKISQLTNMIDGNGNLVGQGNVYLKEGSYGQPQEAMSMKNDGNVSLGNGFQSVSFEKPTQFNDSVSATNGVNTNKIQSTDSNSSIQQNNDELTVSGEKGVSIKTGNNTPLELDNQKVYVNELCVGSQNGESVCLDEKTINNLKGYLQ